MRKFKIGDKVKILPSAINVGVDESEIGKTAIIRDAEEKECIIINTDSKYWGPWWVRERDIELVVVVVKGQQLLFSFMTNNT